jgi:hypothetical protein
MRYEPIFSGLLALCLVGGSCRAEEVSVTLTGGKVQTGELIEQTIDRVVLRQSVGGNKLDMPIPWSKITAVSNGLTREQVMKTWKAANKDKLCATCGGDRKVACAKCTGTGALAKDLLPCAACQSTGQVACKAKGCKEGKTPCPEPCVKRYEGEWKPGEKNQDWRKFPTKNGQWYELSDGHVGEIWEVIDGKPTNQGKCKTCEGTTYVNCKACEGAGKVNCAACKGQKQVPAAGPAKKCPDCEAGKINCADCKGTGLKP